MGACTFFGHSDCYGLDESVLMGAIEEQIHNGVDTFYVGHQGQFDRMVFHCLTALQKTHPHVSFGVVLAYLPTGKHDPYQGGSLYPEEVSAGPPRFAIERRNKWMIAKAHVCLCYVTHPWGGAYKFAKQAKRAGLTVINMGDTEL